MKKVLIVSIALLVAPAAQAQFARFSFVGAIQNAYMAGVVRVLKSEVHRMPVSGKTISCGVSVTLERIASFKGDLPQTIVAGSEGGLIVGNIYFVTFLKGKAAFPTDVVFKYPKNVEKAIAACNESLPPQTVNWLTAAQIKARFESSNTVSCWLEKPLYMDIPKDIDTITYKVNHLSINGTRQSVSKLNRMLAPLTLWAKSVFASWPQLLSQWYKASNREKPSANRNLPNVCSADFLQ